MKEYKFDVETVRCGQPRPYADSEYEYIVKSELPANIVESFCRGVLCYAFQTKSQWNHNNAASYFAGYYTFEEIGENTYKYYVLGRFCD